MTPIIHPEPSQEIFDPSVDSFHINLTDNRHIPNAYLTSDRTIQSNLGHQEIPHFSGHNAKIMNSNYDEEFTNTLDHAVASLLQTKAEPTTYNSTPESLTANDRQQFQQHFPQQQHNTQYTFGQLNEIDDTAYTPQLHQHTAELNQPQNFFATPVQNHCTPELNQSHNFHAIPAHRYQTDQFAPPVNISRSELSRHFNHQTNYHHIPSPFHDKVTKPQHNRYSPSSSTPSFHTFEEAKFSESFDDLSTPGTFHNRDQENLAENQFYETQSLNCFKQVKQRNPYSYQNSGTGNNAHFECMFQLPFGLPEEKPFTEVPLLNSPHCGMADNKANSLNHVYMSQTDTLDSVTSDIDLATSALDFSSSQIGNLATVESNQNLNCNIPFPSEKKSMPNLLLAPDIRNNFNSTTSHQQTTSLYDPEQFRGRSYDFKTIETPNETYPSGKLHTKQNQAAFLFQGKQVDESLESLKFFIGHDSSESDIKYVISRLNSTQLQKFSETKYFPIIGESSSMEQTLHKVMPKATGNTMHTVKEDLFESWDVTKSSLTIYFCNCKKFIWKGPTPTRCPFDVEQCKHPKNLEEVNTGLDPPKIQDVTTIPMSRIHIKIPFNIELFNNHILSILLSKKLRTYLKKTIRPSKMLKEKCRYMRLLQDGKIYKDAIEEDIDKIDFAFTLTMCTPKISGAGPESKSMNAVYFIFNELPLYLRYRPEFMFLACALDANDKKEWDEELLTPLFAYLNFLKDNIIRVSLNRHEYHVKIVMTMALANDQTENGALLNVIPPNSLISALTAQLQVAS